MVRLLGCRPSPAHDAEQKNAWWTNCTVFYQVSMFCIHTSMHDLTIPARLKVVVCRIEKGGLAHRRLSQYVLQADADLTWSANKGTWTYVTPDNLLLKSKYNPQRFLHTFPGTVSSIEFDLLPVRWSDMNNPKTTTSTTIITTTSWLSSSSITSN